MNYQYILEYKELFPYAIGITYDQFEKLLQALVPIYRTKFRPFSVRSFSAVF